MQTGWHPSGKPRQTAGPSPDNPPTSPWHSPRAIWLQRNTAFWRDNHPMDLSPDNLSDLSADSSCGSRQWHSAPIRHRQWQGCNECACAHGAANCHDKEPPPPRITPVGNSAHRYYTGPQGPNLRHTLPRQLSLPASRLLEIQRPLSVYTPCPYHIFFDYQTMLLLSQPVALPLFPGNFPLANIKIINQMDYRTG